MPNEGNSDHLPDGASGPEQLTPDANQQLAFLYKALDDNQGLIRFLDTKAGFAIALLSAMVGKVLSDIGSNGFGFTSLWRASLLCAFAFCTVAAVLIVSRILFPVSNPTRNCRLLQGTDPQFFFSELQPRRFRRIFTSSPRCSSLAQDHAEYFERIIAADAAVLLRVMSGEVLKVSYVRQIKTDRLKWLTFCVLGCALLFILLTANDAAQPRPTKPALVRLQGPVTVDGALPRAAPVPKSPAMDNMNAAAQPNGERPRRRRQFRHKK
jgi:hypothetical protein